MTEHHTPARSVLSEDQIEDLLQEFADGFSFQRRSPILHSPRDQGLHYEDVTFPSGDGVPLEGWFIPAPGSEKVVIANHPMGFNRSGMPTHLEPWRSQWAASGNAFDIDFTPDYRILHEAGFNVLAYDLRNHGHSGEGNGGISSTGIYEARDVASIGFGPRNPRLWAKSVSVPTFLYQVRDDVLTHTGDVQTMFDNIPVADKKLHWIEGTTARFDGYREFQRRPGPALDWFATHLS
jgi:hypothetical protein